MARIILDFPSVCQMSDNPNGKPSSRQPELLGYGSGGNRCTESCLSGIAWKLNLANVQGRFTYPEDVMFWITEQWNGGRDVSSLENGQRVVDWVNSNGGKMWGIGATYADIVAMVNRGNVGMAGFSDYNKLTKANGQSPYSWRDPDGDGHVLMVVGYNTDVSPNTIFVHDSLLGDNSQPTEYSWAGFQNAQFNSLSEVQISMVPKGPFISVTAGHGGVETSGNGIAAHFGTSWADICNIPGQTPGLSNYDPTGPYLYRPSDGYGVTLLVPGYPGQVSDLQSQLDNLQKQKAADDQQIKDLNALVAQLQASQGIKPDPAVHQALVQAANALQPFFDAKSAVDAALKEI